MIPERFVAAVQPGLKDQHLHLPQVHVIDVDLHEERRRALESILHFLRQRIHALRPQVNRPEQPGNVIGEETFQNIAFLGGAGAGAAVAPCAKLCGSRQAGQNQRTKGRHPSHNASSILRNAPQRTFRDSHPFRLGKHSGAPKNRPAPPTSRVRPQFAKNPSTSPPASRRNDVVPTCAHRADALRAIQNSASTFRSTSTIRRNRSAAHPIAQTPPHSAVRPMHRRGRHHIVHTPHGAAVPLLPESSRSAARSPIHFGQTAGHHELRPGGTSRGVPRTPHPGRPRPPALAPPRCARSHRSPAGHSPRPARSKDCAD